VSTLQCSIPESRRESQKQKAPSRLQHPARHCPHAPTAHQSKGRQAYHPCDVRLTNMLSIAVLARRGGGRGEASYRGTEEVGRSGPTLKPGTVCVCCMNGLRKGMHTIWHPLSPACKAGTDLPTNVQAVPRAVSYVITHRPRFQVRTRPSSTPG